MDVCAVWNLQGACLTSYAVWDLNFCGLAARDAELVRFSMHVWYVVIFLVPGADVLRLWLVFVYRLENAMRADWPLLSISGGVCQGWLPCNDYGLDESQGAL